MPTLRSTDRILSYLKSGRVISTQSAAFKFGITTDSVRARITELRKAGYPIYTNEKKNTARGGTTCVYRLGIATRREVAAGKLLLSDPVMSALFAPELEYNLSLSD